MKPLLIYDFLANPLQIIPFLTITPKLRLKESFDKEAKNYMIMNN